MTLSTSAGARARTAALATLTIAAVAVLAGCSGGTADDGSTTVRFLSWDDASVMQPIVDAFEAENPDISVEISNVADVAQYQSALQPQLLAGTAPDLFILGSKTEMVGAGYLEDLSDQPFVDALSPANILYGSYEGSLYGVSIASWGGGWAFNTDALSEVGVSGPDDYPQSWDEFLQLLEALRGAGWDTPFLEANATGIPSSMCALSGIANAEAGGDLDAQVFAGETTWAEHWTEPWEQWVRLFDEGHETRDVVGITGEQVNQEFANGNVAIIGSASWAMGQLNDLDTPFEISFMPVPGAEDGTSYLCGAAGPAVSVNANSEVKDEALAFLAFLTTPEAAQLYNEANGQITTTAGFVPTVDPALDPIVGQIQAGEIYLPIVNWPQYQDALDAELNVVTQRMILGEMTPAEAAAAMDAKLAEVQG